MCVEEWEADDPVGVQFLSIGVIVKNYHVDGWSVWCVVWGDWAVDVCVCVQLV